MSSEMTTVRIRRSTRELILAAARDQHCTVDEYVTGLVVEEQWRERMALAARLMTAPDSEYHSEVEMWDMAALDGLS